MKKPSNNLEILQQAAEWAVRLDDDGELSRPERNELAAWLTESPRNIDELLLAVSTYAALDESCKQSTVSIDDLLSRADMDDNVTDLRPVARVANVNPRTGASYHRWRQFSQIAASIFVAVLIVSSVAMFSIGRDTDPGDVTRYSTIVGEQRTVPLPDGSIMHINTQTEIELIYSESERLVELVKGEALFDVASDPGRPFRVVANDVTAEAIGTKFNVFLDEDTINIAVIEGIVAFEGGAALFSTQPPQTGDSIETIAYPPVEKMDDGRVKLVAGSTVEVQQSNGVAAVGIAAQDIVTSWRERKLIFASDTLETIVGEFNRYNRQQIVVDGLDLSQLELSGIFNADNPEAFVEFLRLYVNIDVNNTPDGTVVLSLRDAD